MDQLKQYLSVARKHHFWILCGVAALAGIVAWYLSTSSLKAEFEKGKGKVDSHEQMVKGISLPHANERWKELKTAETERLTGQVLDVWGALYAQQNEAVYSKWPQGLNQDFMAALARHEANPRSLIPDKLREHYQNVIRNEVNRFAEIVDCEPATEGTGSASPVRPQRFSDEGAGAAVPLIEHRVSWPQLKEIREYFDWDIAPSTALIKMVQEELWVYEALCKVIAKVNEGSTGAHNAPIKEISNMAIAYSTFQGQGAGSPRSWLSATGAPIAAGEDMGLRPSPAGIPGVGGIPDPRTRLKRNAGGGDSEFTRPMPMAADPAVPAADPDEIWKNYRYVTPSNSPIMGAELETRSPPEYNLMPFRLNLVIDPRKIDKLLLELCNSTLPFEVREVRINPEAGGSSFGGGRNYSANRFDEGGGSGKTNQPRTVNLEVSGVAYLIKKPDPTKVAQAYQDLGGSAAPAEAAAEY